ncbi:MAG: CRISPR-associated endonuclease Cas2 [Thermoleophilia bacterium]
MRSRYLLCYDVRDEKRLRRTIKVAESWGYRLQYSVFVCDLSEVEKSGLERDLRGVLRLDIDRVVLIDLGPPGASSARRLHWVSAPAPLPVTGEATIV